MTTPTEARVEDPFRDAAWFADAIGMSEDWVRHNAGRLPRHKVGSRLRFDQHCVDRYREMTAVTPNDMRQTPRSARTNGDPR